MRKTGKQDIGTDESMTGYSNPNPRRGWRFHRIREIASHGYRYAFDPVSRLSEDLGVSRSTTGRILRGEGRLTRERMRRIAELLSADLRLPVSLRVEDVFSPDGNYEEPSACALCDCDGCSLTDGYYSGIGFEDE